MHERMMRQRLLLVFVLASCALMVWLPRIGGADARQPSPYLSVTFLDVGQGDAVLIETPDGVQVLVDGGRDSTVLTRLSGQLGWLDHTIDMVIGTHPDLDHIGGLIDVLERYQVTDILTTENMSESDAFIRYHDLEKVEGAEIIYARAGEIFRLGASTTLAVLSPTSDPEGWESNTSSIVVQLRYGDTEFMLTGDAPQGIEEYLVKHYGSVLESEVLKLGHHGSKTASAPEFLAAVEPEYAVVSAGVDNRYGHPAPEVVERAGGAGAQVLSTQDLGSITFHSDGTNVWVEN